MSRIMMSWIGALALAGCTGGNGGPDEPADGSTMRSLANLDPALSQRADQARRDLSTRFNLAADDVQIERAEFVTWRNGALGCPEPGMDYTQAVVPGYRVILAADGELHHYHGARGRAPFHCPQDRIDKPLPAEQAEANDAV